MERYAPLLWLIVTAAAVQSKFGQECGIMAPRKALIGGRPKIVGGAEAERHSWPWQVSLRTVSTNFHFCGGSILSDSWIMTAAHCVDSQTTSTMKVVTGEHRKSTTSGSEMHHGIEKIIIHEDYNEHGNGFPNDMALIKLSEPMPLDEYRQPICLAEIDEGFYGNRCYITGWGRTQGTGDQDVLNELVVDVWSQAACTARWTATNINPGHICVGTGDTGACNGDSGGPLACYKTRNGISRWVVAGAASWVYRGCQTAGYPTVYTRVSYFRDWVDTKMREN